MNKRTLAILMAATLCSRGLQAEEIPESYLGQEVVVSATKTLNSIADAGGSSVTVISSKEIAASGQTTIEEIIKGMPGLDIASNGGIGSTTSIFIRGADSKYTLVLIDNVPLNDPADGSTAPNISNLTADNIERIEILRGPASMLYGSGASAGVINIITKKGTEKRAGYVGAEAGAYNTRRVYGGASGRQGILDYSVTASRLKTDGFSTRDERNPVINPTGQSYEKDGYENSLFSGSFGLKLARNISLETVLRYTDAEYEYDGSTQDQSDVRQKSSQFSGRVALKADYRPLLSTFYYHVSDQFREYFKATGLESTYDGNLQEIGWQGDLALTENNVLTMGVNHQEESMSKESFPSASSDIDKSIGTTSLFVQDQWGIGSFRFVGGIRYENNEQFGDKTTFRIAPSYTIGDTVLKCSYATGFNAPSINQLYGGSVPPFYPNPVGNENLKPETSKGWDAGFEHTLSDYAKVGATYFRTDFKDRIAFDTLVEKKYVQIEGTTTTRGVESFVEWKVSKPFSLGMNYTYTYTDDAQGKELVRRPKHKAGLSGSWKPTGKLTLNTAMQWVGSRKDSAARNDDGVLTGKLDSYFLANISASYKLNPSVELYGRIDNLFDEYYEEAWSYATPGRSAYAGVKLSF